MHGDNDDIVLERALRRQQLQPLWRRCATLVFVCCSGVILWIGSEFPARWQKFSMGRYYSGLGERRPQTQNHHMVAKLTRQEALNRSVEMTLTSFNVRVEYSGESWEARGRNASTLKLLAESPRASDIIVLQECSEFLLAEVAKMLPRHSYVVGERSDGHKGNEWYEYLPIYYDAQRFDLQRSGSFWIGDDPTRPGATWNDGRNTPRLLHWAALRDNKAKTPLLIANLHLNAGAANDAARYLVSSYVRRLAGDLPVVVAGDFNAVNATLTGFADAARRATRVSGPVDRTTIAANERTPFGSRGFRYASGGMTKRASSLSSSSSSANSGTAGQAVSATSTQQSASSKEGGRRLDYVFLRSSRRRYVHVDAFEVLNLPLVQQGPADEETPPPPPATAAAAPSASSSASSEDSSGADADAADSAASSTVNGAARRRRRRRRRSLLADAAPPEQTFGAADERQPPEYADFPSDHFPVRATLRLVEQALSEREARGLDLELLDSAEGTH